MSATQNEGEKLMYQPFSSILNPGFWQQLTNIKLNQLRLSKEPVRVRGSYSCNLADTLPCLASFEHNSFGNDTVTGNKSSCPLHGSLICTNIIQEFLDLNKKEHLDQHGNEIWQSILDGRALANPEQYLSRFSLLVYADLKKYKYTYWFAFPALNYPKDVYVLSKKLSTQMDGDSESTTQRPVLDVFSETALQKLQEEYDKPVGNRKFSRAYFIVKHYIDASTEADNITIYPLTDYHSAAKQEEGQKCSAIYFAYSDPSGYKVYPGWPLRNYLCLIATQFRLDRVNILRIRKGNPTSTSKIELHHSKILDVKYCLEHVEGTDLPHVSGWEKNETSQIAPKRVNLSSLLDPKKIAEDAVNLNLRLMKWRLLPGLNLEKIAETKCLILGCGTLGCHIARGLLAWGVKKISLVDNGKVSFSNPVRQTLYNFDDCTTPNGLYKANAAAASLKKIHPLVQAEPHVLAIPMPGHHIADKEIDQTKEDIAELEGLIESHDAIFLLMDTRESRWLPTVIAMSMQKLVINAAIGFDTFLLQRFGIRNYSDLSGEQSQHNLLPAIPTSSVSSSTNEPSTSCSRNKSCSLKFLHSDQLGCYFCNDIVAPGDSTQDRTLDQQCTVSRPGVSMMVSAMAVELLASIMSSNSGAQSPAPLDVHNDTTFYEEDFGSELGIIPHSIRGNLSRYHIYMPTTPAFHKCAACSPAVVNTYRASGYEFLQRVFDDPAYLEELAGLKELQSVNDNVWALDSDEEDVACIEEDLNQLAV